MKKLPQRKLKGLEAEERFLCVVRKLLKRPWLQEIRQAPPNYDACGIDAVARIQRKSDGEFIRVPVQIKSSEAGVEYHFAKRPDHWFARVVCVVVSDKMASKAVARAFEKALEHVRTHGYDFEDLFREIEETSVPLHVVGRIEEDLRLFEEHRMAGATPGFEM